VAAIIEFLAVLYLETDYMLLEAGEFKMTAEQQRQQIETRTRKIPLSRSSANTTRRSSASSSGWARTWGRIRHILYLVLGVLGPWHGKGIGYRLMTEVTGWAQSHDIRRMELNVDARNTGAIELYKKMGFQVEGVRRKARRFGDVLVDEYWMGRLF
jgi:GNAT superfamily N-acetyltransferase